MSAVIVSAVHCNKSNSVYALCVMKYVVDQWSRSPGLLV